jgi:hypothetical protein
VYLVEIKNRIWDTRGQTVKDGGIGDRKRLVNGYKITFRHEE